MNTVRSKPDRLDMNEDYVSVDQLVTWLNRNSASGKRTVSKSHIYKCLNEGTLEGKKFGDKWLIPVTAKQQAADLPVEGSQS